MNACYNSKPMKLSLSEFVQYICQAKAAKETQLAKVYVFIEWCSSLLMMFESSSGIPFSRQTEPFERMVIDKVLLFEFFRGNHWTSDN